MKMHRFGARYLLAAIGGLAARVAGVGGHYQPDYQTPKKKSNRIRIGRGGYGRTLINHFDGVGINWPAKQNKMDKARDRARSRA